MSSKSSKILKLAQSGYDAALQLNDELHELTQAFGRNSDQISSLADSIERFIQREDGNSIIERDKILAEIKKLKSEELNQYSRITLRTDDLKQGLTYLSAMSSVVRRLISMAKMFSVLRNFLLSLSILTFLIGLYYGISATILLLSL